MPLTRRTDFDVQIDTVATPESVILGMTITNNSPNTCFISADSILANGYIKSFDIECPSYIPCMRGRVDQINGNEMIELKSGESQASLILLSNFCSFSHLAPVVNMYLSFMMVIIYTLMKININIMKSLSWR